MVGVVTSLLSMLSVFAQVVVYIFGTKSVPGWASLFTVSTLINGVQLLFLGILGEYVGLIFDEVKNRPRYLIERHYKLGRITEEQSLSLTPATDRTAPVGAGGSVHS